MPFVSITLKFKNVTEKKRTESEWLFTYFNLLKIEPKGVCEMTGLTFYCFVRIFDSCSIGKLSSLYNPTELKIFQIILPMIIESDKGYVSNNDIGKNSTSYSTVVFFLIKNKLFFFF